MIGQQEVIEKLKSSNSRSILITGPAHHGKKTLVRELLSKEEAVFEITGNANDFRESVERICTTVRPTAYIIPDLDKRHPTVQNLLLKVIEEPPLKSRFYITASGSLLPTIVSRCVSYRITPYTETQLASVNVADWCRPYAHSPGELQILNEVDLSSVIPLLESLQKELVENQHTLAYLLKQFRDVSRQWASLNASHEAFILLSNRIFKEEPGALSWLRQQPNDSVRYIRSQFLMKCWLERQEMF